jgi:2-C-methyl-D-erythritol 4-phosphate cytidylyltransferase
VTAAAILVCAGSGVRMGAPGDKLFLDLGGRPVVEWALDAVVGSGEVDTVVVVASEGNLHSLAALVQRRVDGVALHLVLGGARRQDSVRAGLEYLAALPGAAGHDLVAVHDGARPLAGPDLLRRTLAAAREHGAATAAIAVRDSVKEADGQGFVRRSLERAALVAVQTPQAFRFDLLLRAHREGLARGAEVDDDAELVERLGLPVRLVEGEAANVKVTTPEDLVALRAHLAGAPAPAAGGRTA